MMTWMFRNKIMRTGDVYIDDMMFKIKEEHEHIDDLRDMFEVIQ